MNVVRLQKERLILIFTSIIAFSLITVFPNHIFGQVQPITGVEEKLAGIAGEEKEILEALFTLSQEIEEMDRKEANIVREIRELQGYIEELEGKIEQGQQDYDRRAEVLKRVLVSYQKRGPASYLETLLMAEDLTAFLRNVNVIRNLARNVGELLDTMEAERIELLAEKESLSEKAAVMENQKTVLQQALAKKLALKEEQEAYLASLEDERSHYEEQLGNLQQMWAEITVLFLGMVQEFSDLMQEGSFPMEALNLGFEFPMVKGAINEKTMNDMLKEHESLEGMDFHFYPGKVQIAVPEKHLILEGTFLIEDKKALKFEVARGSFYDMPLETASIGELFRDGTLFMDFRELIGDSTFESIEIKEGQLVFKIKPNLW